MCKLVRAVSTNQLNASIASKPGGPILAAAIEEGRFETKAGTRESLLKISKILFLSSDMPQFIARVSNVASLSTIGLLQFVARSLNTIQRTAPSDMPGSKDLKQVLRPPQLPACIGRPILPPTAFRFPLCRSQLVCRTKATIWLSFTVLTPLQSSRTEKAVKHAQHMYVCMHGRWADRQAGRQAGRQPGIQSGNQAGR